MLDTVVSAGGNQQPSRRERRAVLFGLAETRAEAWICAATDHSLACLRAKSFEACATLGSKSIPTVLLVGISAFEPVMASHTDPRFRRTTLIACGVEASQIPLWKLVGWNAVATNEDPSRLGPLLVDATREAAKRTEDWDTYDTFKSRLATLSGDEVHVFEAVCKGRLNKQMASDLGVSIRTVEQRRRRLFSKMQVESAVPLAAMTARVKAMDDRIAREQNRERQRQPIPPKTTVPKPKLYAGYQANNPSLVTPTY